MFDKDTCELCVHTNDKKYSMGMAESTETDSITTDLIEDKRALNNQVWNPEETLYWQLDSTYEHLSYKDQIKLIKLAFLETSLITPLKIQQKRKQSGDAQIRINWLGVKDENYFKDKSNVLAFAYGPQQGVGGDVTMNADHLWLLRDTQLTMAEAFHEGYIDEYDKSHPNTTKKYYDPVHTMKHEAGGHACGMRHLTNIDYKNTEIMYPYYNGKRVFGDGDIDYLTSLYGQVGGLQRIRRLIEHKMGRF